jgi:predicted transport protein
MKAIISCIENLRIHLDRHRKADLKETPTRTIDKFCMELDPANVQRKYLATYIRYTYGKNIFCCACLFNSGLRVWLKLNYTDLEKPPEYIRDVSSTGHWGVGNIELTIDSLDRFQSAKIFIQKSFEKNK